MNALRSRVAPTPRDPYQRLKGRGDHARTDADTDASPARRDPKDGTHGEGQAVLRLRSDCRAADSRPAIVKIFRTCSCGAAFADVATLDEHLDEYGDGSSHTEIALDLDTLVRLGIRRIRMTRGFTMDQMGGLLGVSTGTISRIESGQRHAIGWGRTPRSVAVLLGVEVSELLRICGRCGYRPPEGYQCHWCGMSGESR